MIDSSPEPRPAIDWNLWMQWVLATTVAWLVGWAVVGDIGIGLVVGLAQWFPLRQLGRPAIWWIPASTVGWLAGWTLIVSGWLVPANASGLSTVISGAVLGLTTGLAQWLVMRLLTRRAGWWIFASIVGWAVGLTGLLGASLVGAVVGALTGFMLDVLKRSSTSSRS